MRCEKHPKHRVISICGNCNDELVCKKCLKTAHNGHELKNFTNGAPQKVKSSENISDVQKDTTKHIGNGAPNGHVIFRNDDLITNGDHGCQNSVLPITIIEEKATDTTDKEHSVVRETSEIINHINLNIQSITHSRKLLKYETDAVVKNVALRGAVLKEQVDKVVKDFEKKCRHLERTQNDMLTSVEGCLLSYTRRLRKCGKKSREPDSVLTELKSEIKKCRTEVHKLVSEHEELFSRIMVHEFKVPSISTVDLIHSFGNLHEKAYVISKEDRLKIQRASSPLPSPNDFPVHVLSRFSFGDEVVRSICSVSSGLSWIVREKQSMVFTDVQLTSLSGDHSEDGSSVIFNAGVLDMTSDKNDVTLVCCTDNTVREITSDGECITLYRTNGRPESLCILSNAAVVACFYQKGRVMKFGHKGRILNFLQRGENSVTFITNPFRVRTNRNNDNVAVLNADPYALVLLDKHLQMKCVYNGTTMDAAHVRKRGGIKSAFDIQIGPNDVCFDAYDNIFITDVVSKSIIMLDPSGHFVGKVLPGDLLPSAISVDKDGNLWIGYFNGFIQVVKYKESEREIQ